MSTQIIENDIIFPGEGPYDFPIIKPESFVPCDFIPFNYALTHKNQTSSGIHFFIDDYQFERIWPNLAHYSEFLSRFHTVMSPDFSIYLDWPNALNIWNHYRKHYVGAYLQSLGVRVYPSICWYGRRSFRWCFDGEPKHAVVAVSNVGANKGKANKRGFMLGYDAMLEHLSPEVIVFYGSPPKACRGNIVPIGAFVNKFREEDEDE